MNLEKRLEQLKKNLQIYIQQKAQVTILILQIQANMKLLEEIIEGQARNGKAKNYTPLDTSKFMIQ